MGPKAKIIYESFREILNYEDNCLMASKKQETVEGSQC